MSHTEVEASPVKVHVVRDDTAHQAPVKKELRVTHRTLVLTAANPYLQVVGYDPVRKEVRMTISDNAIVISGDTGQASAPENIATGLPNPRGRYVPVELPEIVIPGPDEVWISAAAYPTRVGITIVRKV